MRKIKRRKYSTNSKLTRRVKSIIAMAIKDKLPLTRAVELAGISYLTYANWMKRGLDKKERRYWQFRIMVKRLMADREREAISVIRKGAIGGEPIIEKRITRGPRGREITTVKKKTNSSWQAASRYLEIIAREIYGQKADYPIHEEEQMTDKRQLDLTGGIEVKKKSMADALRKLEVEDLDRLADILQKVND